MSDEQKKEETTDVAETPATNAAEPKPETAENAAPVEATPAAEATESTGEVVADEAREEAEKEAAEQQAAEETLEAEVVQDKQVLKPGMTVRVHFTIREGEKTRVQVFQGLIVAMRGKTEATKTMTVRKNSFGVGVERIFPLASPLIEKIEVVKIAKVRRSKLFFVRNYTKRLKETLVKS